MRRVHAGPLGALGGALGLLAVLAVTPGLAPAGWLVGTGSALVLAGCLAGAMARHRTRRLGPADRVTLARAVLVCGIAALAASPGGAVLVVLVPLTVAALVLDAVDGPVARRTGTVSELGARFDLEVDAFLVLVLSAYVAPATGWWVLAFGAARYAFVAAGLVLPWLRATLPPRRWCKVVAATEGVVLTVVAAGVLPPGAARVLLVAAAVLLAESFGREVRDLWRLRRGEGAAPAGQGRRIRQGGAGAAWSLLAVAVVWAALLLPDRVGDLTPATFLAVPVEGLVLAALVLVLPRGAGRAVAVAAGVLLAVLVLVRVLDMGFRVALDRPFDPVWDPPYLGSGVALLIDSVGRTRAVLTLVVAGLLCVCVLVLVPLASARVAGLARRHGAAARRAVVALAVVWAVGAVAGLRVSGAPVGAASTAASASAHLAQVVAGVRDRPEFMRALADDRLDDRLDDRAGGRLLGGLRGKDVLVVFVESYGRVALDGSLGESVRPTLRRATQGLAAAGFSSRSGYLTSPTYGGISWLAHATLQSGVWVDSQRRHDQLLASDRLTLSHAFGRAGWRTLAVVPANKSGWPEGQAFYEFDQMYDAGNLGYAGPKFGYARMPDQYTLAELWRRELADAGHAPVMAEVDLVSSHSPWAPLPRLLGWDEVGDGSVYAAMAAEGATREEVWSDGDRLRAAYLQSVRYSLDALFGFVERYGDDDLVLVVLGDHQPSSVVSGPAAGRDVPVSVVARDPAVLRRVAGWGWRPGLDPGRDGPVWRMDDFRDRFLTAFSSGPGREPTTGLNRTAP